MNGLWVLDVPRLFVSRKGTACLKAQAHAVSRQFVVRFSCTCILAEHSSTHDINNDNKPLCYIPVYSWLQHQGKLPASTQIHPTISNAVLRKPPNFIAEVMNTDKVSLNRAVITQGSAGSGKIPHKRSDTTLMHCQAAGTIYRSEPTASELAS